MDCTRFFFSGVPRLFMKSSNTFRPAFVRFLGNVHINQKLTVAEEQERSVSN